MKKTRNINERITRYVIMTIAVIIVVVIFVLGGISDGMLMSKTSQLHKAKTEKLAEEIAKWYDEEITIAETIANTVEYYEMTSNPSYNLREYLADCLAKNETVFDYYVCLENKKCYFAGGWDPSPEEYDPTTRDWYKEAVSSKTTVISPAYVDAQTGRIVITISKPLYEKGSLVGVFAADIFIDDLVEMAQNEFSNKKEYAVLVDNSGAILTHKDEKFVPYADENGEEHIAQYTDAKLPKKLFGNDTTVKRVGFDYDHSFRVFTSTFLKDYGITVIYVDTSLNYYGGILIFFIGCVAILVMAMVGCGISIKKVLKPMFAPLNELSVVADNMSNGVLDYKAEYTADDEIGNLCIAIEKSNEAIKSYIEDISNKLQAMENGDFTVRVTMDYIGDFAPLKYSINQIGDSLRNAMQLINGAAESVYKSAEDVAAGANNLAEDVMSVTRLMDEGNGAVVQVTDKFKINRTQADESIEISKDAQGQLASGNSQIIELLAAMEKISQTSAQISAIIGTINEIAEQTNLLALNASIEAARAGEAGKGFAVVADSVRELASKTAEAAVDTTELIELSTQAVSEGSRLAKATVANMQVVVNKSEDVNKYIKTIADSIENETEIINLVSKNFEEMSEFTSNTSATSEECVALSQELFEQVEKMNQIIEKFKV